MGWSDFLPLVKAVLPPEEEDMHAVRRWRLNHSMLLIFVGTAMGVHILWACGFIPGVPGFARSDELHSVVDAVTEAKLMLIDQAVIEARRNQCEFRKEGNVAAQEFAAARVRELVHRWNDMEPDNKYHLPSCDESIGE